METLNLERIMLGYPGLTPAIGEAIFEATLVCLAVNNHRSEQPLKLYGDVQADVSLIWDSTLTDQMILSWNDQVEAVESAAVCLAILIADSFLEMIPIRRSVRGTGFDYWMAVKGQAGGDFFDRLCRLEVSGILRGNRSILEQRVQTKVKQIRKSDSSGLPSLIIVVEFSNLVAKLHRGEQID